MERRVPPDELAAAALPADVGVPASNVAKVQAHSPKGILVVHGIGAQQQSGTLLTIGAPLLAWAATWLGNRGRTPMFDNAGLDFGQVDDLMTKPPPHVTLRVPGNPPDSERTAVDDELTWIMAEAWWSASSRSPGFGTIFVWVVRHVFDVVRNLFTVTRRRVERLVSPTDYDPDGFSRGVDLVNSVFLTVVLFVGLVVSLPAVTLLMLATQIPIQAVQDFVLTRLLLSFLGANIGEMKTLLDDDVQAANIRSRIEQPLQWLVDQGCDDLYILAHSGGAIASFEVLSHSSQTALISKVRKFFTIGDGLNKAWILKPASSMLRGPIADHIHWLDFWASYDPVPAGGVTPPPNVAVFAPSPTVIEQERLAKDVDRPVDLQVSNWMDTLSDHGGYWHNDEQVVSRLAQEIDAPTAAPYYQQSRFFGDVVAVSAVAPRTQTSEQYAAAQQLPLRPVKERRQRVSVLAAIRAWAVAVFIGTVVTWWSNLTEIGDHFWRGLSHVPGVTGATAPFDALLRQVAPGVASQVENVLFGVLASALIALIFYVVYNLGFSSLWSRWDERARSAWIAVDPEASQPNPVVVRLWMLVWIAALAGVPIATGAVIGLGAGAAVWPVVGAALASVAAALTTMVIFAVGASRSPRR